ncbi:helicase-exonuclease AddAB subunit AddA [Paenibacillus hemerocallicola]|uniref:ATP-dependent helicase/nuclease subunit A n=1 Tax=Paenibacillus hemerocallicola TaxID=1172614 RepID=A0A5C4T516_9BACL|nr:helicase-exonuclease AddAB subunit AddA [Paenibacillus hemerocallicola]TNJ64164.1 helicase-exonuclease AddAB subunit AddA [Paenibacillus hemerocallicola]
MTNEAGTAGGRQARAAKPAGSTWTDEQWEAVRLRGSDILVAAAAGSGKTAVLVERIIRRITDEREPVDVDRLLVATFTNAAAGEMRQRIREAIEKRLAEHPESEHLRRQIALIHRASITTLHSFCLDVIRRHHQRIRLDPAFRIANETEAELMRQDILSDLLEEQYGQSEDDSAFWRLADAFGGERGDDALFRLVQRLYDYSRSHPWPDFWLLDTAGKFEPSSDEAGETSGESDPWRKALIADVKLELQGMASLLEEALRLCSQPGGPMPYTDNMKDDLVQIEGAIAAAERSWDGLFAAIRDTAFGKLNACRGKEYDKALQERVKQLRDRAKKQFADIREELFERTPEQYAAEMAEMAPVVRKLAELVIEFGERYRLKKAEKGLVDFSDLEHYSLDILRHPDSSPGRLIPSDAAEQYRDQFVEILLDEYQDTNTVQEAIVSLISRPAPGNRFMVGDVKQSIYRFRLAEPGLFMDKYRSFEPSGEDNPSGGRKIDLARNFRSRTEIVDGVNYIFKQIMTERVGEMDYDEAARLVCGAVYPGSPNDLAVEMAVMDRGGAASEEDAAEGNGIESDDTDDSDDISDIAAAGTTLEQEEKQAETAQLEARYIVSRIRRMMGQDGHTPFQVHDRGTGGLRPIVFRDIVILLRATSQWAPVFMDELRAAGIPGYADLNTGYFTATEVETMLSLLQIIDNPYQDIPVAAVLRSPMFGLNAAELAQIRILGRNKPYYEAVLSYAAGDAEMPDGTNAVHNEDEYVAELRSKLSHFIAKLQSWRDEARQGSLSQLIWNVYRETGYYDFVGGMPGGGQRQANLRALYDRARQYEATSLRGLFRFLRFVERMRDSGADLGAARALGEQEDVVRIMSIHKSKGLEFPVVFVAGLGKSFNQTDLGASFLLHKELGFGPMFTDPVLRVACPTLPMLAIRRRMKMEMIAEEFRVLYVALTRPKEKMVLVGTVKSADKAAQKWTRMQDEADWQLPAHEMARARSYLDWLGPALIRHPDAGVFRDRGESGESYFVPAIMTAEPSRWSAGIVSSLGYAQAAAAVEVRFADDRMESVAQLEPVTGREEREEADIRLDQRFDWTYGYGQATEFFSKTSVSELKRLKDRSFGREDPEAADWAELPLEPDETAAGRQNVPGSRSALQSLARRPAFLGKREMTAAERGTIYHAVMQHIPLENGISAEDVRITIDRMVSRQLLAPEHRDAVDAEVVASFFREEIGRRLLAADKVYREVPFSYGLPAEEAYPGAEQSVRGETVLVQGIIDCLFEENGGLVLLDYKTDAVYGDRLDMLKERYAVQLGLYAKAIEHIWRRPVKEKVLYFFDGPHFVRLGER